MPTIRDMFLPEAADDPDFNLDDFLREADTAAAASPARQYAEMGATPGETSPDPQATTATVSTEAEPEVTGEGDATGGETVPTAPPVAEPIAPTDPLLALPADRRAALLALDEVITADPDTRERVFQAIRAPEPQARPSLPEHVDPESFEAQLWQGQREILDRLDQDKAERVQQVRQTEQSNRLISAAQAAGQTIGQRYNLSPEEVTALATTVGPQGSGLAGTLVSRPGRDPQQSFEEALDIAFWQDPELRSRVAGTVTPPAAPPAPVVGPTPEREERKRVLHALSGAASPVAGPPPERVPLETRMDGRLTPASRNSLVDSLAATLRERG